MSLEGVRLPDLRLRLLSTDELTSAERVGLRRMLDLAFGGDFDDEDWQHALGGMHVLLELSGAISAHAAIVERDLRVAQRPLRTGYVEAVATVPSRQRSGLGTRVMRAAGGYIAERFELGALSTGSHAFYARLGWVTWRGPSFVRRPSGEEPTPDNDGSIMVLATPRATQITDELDAPISCEWRAGEVW